MSARKMDRDVMDRLLAHIAEGGSVREFCRQPGNPSKATVYNWRVRDPEFFDEFKRARYCGAEDKFEEALEIARQQMKGETVTTEDDGEKTKTTVRSEDQLGHRKLLVETLLKQAACYDPANFGTRQQLQHTGKVSLEKLVMGSMEPEQE